MFDETLQSEDSCLWFDDGDQDDEEDDSESLYDDEEDADDERRPKSIRYRCSPVCRFSPTVRMLAERYVEQINELLNLFSGALTESVYLHAPYPPYRFTSRRERLFHGRLLTGLGELEAVEDEVRAEWDRLQDDLLSVTGDSLRAEFQRIEHHLRDFRILVALAGCHARYVFHWWDTTLVDLKRSEVLHGFYTARDRMRSRDPHERKAARKRDAKRRKTRHRKEYLAKYEARADVRAKRAERKRAARAADRERRAAQGQGPARIARPPAREIDAQNATVGVRVKGAVRANVRPVDAYGEEVPALGHRDVDRVDVDAA